MKHWMRTPSFSLTCCILSLLLGFSMTHAGSSSALFSPQAAKIEKASPKGVLDKDKLALKADAEITDIYFRTENDRRWAYTYSVANTGFKTWVATWQQSKIVIPTTV